ncbi:tRNA (N(6)-L-threonylcarbamoyladenosine(37)-C(2))-methylthiotransferase MtaB [Blautia obeum]|uniref:Threonylcarbamoyladenosine tRNA methylthiotransferase MtaB n=1 Tax=Blautia obeum TaxID=40520 RepID=A0A3E5A4H2_9FIRM|nr:tRNA (N(6)-L-threonylcarbamoyladenosine(37)-C(2))-methylthiotransferase MtaB [Blautia obeum]RGN03730.1 tRNA (N(6)-L-threonylcarbamoyladenosine(37)-C(2))-methylthiotransferase MtaB [Blautia obeum]RGN87726.1 tRNA (N(6)-L-threonylcarbamoyladenosine(37)-C(2))-methylthiotransferase MtaB [Blautia obeum]RHK92915.1 tRNA (N(6)-L-threonylcarbamoyladenosine(37)-C(2))-methylthiotransferase MtaB [Blautia obeum]
MKKKVALHNLGCKVNAYEVEAMQQLLENAGYETVPFEEGADVYVINTCTVTNIADRKSRQMLHKAKKMNPDAIVVATGCYAQADTEKLKEDTAVDLILGNNQKTQIVEALEEYEKEHAKQVQVIEINHTKEYEELSISSTAEHVRAYIKVQDGCNQFCTYCIIPFARGRVRSRKIEEVLREVETLAAKGYKEVVLTGIHLSSYGVDFPKEERESLLSLIQAVSRVEGISRIRLGSLEPRIITEEFLEGIVKTGKVCPHFHLSLQSGCNKTLKNMNRRYSAQEYAEKCELIRKFYPAPALTTDVIVGFPQETEEDFEESYEFVKKIHFYETHIFKYSRRHGTKAASMDGQLTEAAKAQRSDRMLELHEIRAREYEEAMIGKKMELLLEEEIEIDGRPWYVGHSREYVRAVISKTDAHRVNDLVTVKAVAFVRDHILETKEV